MPTLATYNIPNHLKGDTFNGIAFTLTTEVPAAPIDLTGAAIKVQFRKGNKTGFMQKELSIGSGITVTDAPNGTFQLNPFKADWQPSIYYYDVEITFPSGRVKTYIEGTFKIVQDVTQTA